MPFRIIVPAGLLFAAAASAGTGGDIRLQAGDETEVLASAKTVSGNLSRALTEVRKSLAGMETLLDSRASADPGRFKPQTVVVGLSAQIEAGLGPILKASATPRFRAVFSKNPSPVLP